MPMIRFRPARLALAFLVLAMPALLGTAAAQSDWAGLRDRMVALVEIQAILSAPETGIEELDAEIVAAMRKVPRHEFVPEGLQEFAYSDGPLPIGYDQNIASPFLVALMTQLIRPQAGDRIYETGSGAGYHAAVLSELVAEVYSVEVVAPLAVEVAQNLKRLGYDRVRSREGDGYYGWVEAAPFDAIIVKEAVDHVPAPLLDQLSVGGRMVLPLGPAEKGQMLTVIEKRPDGKITRTGVLPVIFSPLQGGERT